MTKFIYNATLFALVSIGLSVCTQTQTLADAINNSAEDKLATTEALPLVLSPDNFFGPASMGYSAAKAVPHVCNKLFCYCGCDITDNHKSLLDCFVGLHGADCHICQEEALLALKMTNDGKNIPEIQKAVDEGYSMKYPFKTESPALVHYKSTRLWTAGGSSINDKSANKNDSEGTCCSPRKRSNLHSCCSE